MLPECQLRGWKFLTSHRTNKHCTPALHPQPHPPPTLIKSSVSADTESGGGKDGEARTKAEEETADFGALKEMLLEVLLCLRALDPEKLNPKPGSGPVSGPLKVNLLCLTAAWIDPEGRSKQVEGLLLLCYHHVQQHRCVPLVIDKRYKDAERFRSWTGIIDI